MAKIKFGGFGIIGIIMWMFGIKIQRPVKRIKRGRSAKYKIMARAIGKKGNQGFWKQPAKKGRRKRR